MKLILLITFLFMQHPGKPPAPPPGCSNPVPGVQNPNCADDVPIDGGLSILGAIGIYYGAKKLKQRKE